MEPSAKGLWFDACFLYHRFGTAGLIARDMAVRDSYHKLSARCRSMHPTARHTPTPLSVIRPRFSLRRGFTNGCSLRGSPILAVWLFGLRARAGEVNKDRPIGGALIIAGWGRCPCNLVDRRRRNRPVGNGRRAGKQGHVVFGGVHERAEYKPGGPLTVK
jgi:hypothetical protein